MSHEIPESLPDQGKRELSPAEKEQLLSDAEVNLAELSRDIAALKAREAELDEEEKALLGILTIQAEGLRDFIDAGREPGSQGTAKKI